MRRSPKVCIPGVDGLTRRERLEHQLTAALARPVVWVSGQAGAGKTSVVAAFVAHREAPCAWLTVDADDADLATFFFYLSKATDRVTRKRGQLTFTPDYKDGLDAFARRFGRDLFDRLPDRTTLVIDNLEAVPDESEVHQALVTLSRELGENQNLIVTSRSAPPARYATLLAQGAIAQVGNEALRFAEDEVEALRTLTGSGDGPSAHALHAWAHGWAAAMVLGLEHPGQLEHALPSSDAPQVVFDYFAAEVIERLSAEEQDVLVRTSVFPQFSSAQARSVVDDTRAEPLLDRLVERNFFVVRLSLSRPIRYRYHPLFRAFLRRLLAERLDVAAQRKLFSAAAQVLIQDGEAEQAIVLLRQAEDWATLDRVICENAKKWLSKGFHQRVLQWSVFPPETETSAWLYYWRGQAQLPLNPHEARADLTRAYEAFVEEENRDAIFLSASAVMESILFSWRAFTALDPWIERIDAHLAQWGKPSIPVMGRVAGITYSARLFRRLGQPSSERWEKTAKRFLLVVRVIEPGDYILLANSVHTHDVTAGRNKKSRNLIDSLASLRKKSRVHPTAQVAYYVMVCVQELFAGNFALCGKHADEGLALGDNLGIHFWDAILLAHRAYGALYTGQADLALRAVEEMEAHADPGEDFAYVLTECIRTLVASTEGNNDLALLHVRRCVEHARAFGSQFVELTMEIGLAQTLVLNQDAAGAAAALAQVPVRVEEAQTGPLRARMNLVLADIAVQQGRFDDAHEALGTAFSIMRTLDLHSLPWWLPRAIRPLCGRALEAGIEVEQVRAVIAHHAWSAPEAFAGAWPGATRVEVLGCFSITQDGVALDAGTKAQRRPLELVQVLVTLGGRDVSEAQVAGILWPDAEGDAASQSMKVTVHRLRKLLGSHFVQRADGRVSLDVAVRVDALECARAFEQAGGRPPLDPRTLDALTRYRGPLLPHVEEAFVLAPRMALERQYCRAVLRAQAAHREQDATDDAVRLLDRAIGVCPGVEGLYAALIDLLRSRGSHAEAADVLRHCEAALLDIHAASPSPELYASER